MTNSNTTSESSPYYFLLCEDFVSALIGPFPTRAEAETHQKFCEERGDGSALPGSWEIISDFVVGFLDEPQIGMRLTPQQDREFTDL